MRRCPAPTREPALGTTRAALALGRDPARSLTVSDTARVRLRSGRTRFSIAQRATHPTCRSRCRERCDFVPSAPRIASSPACRGAPSGCVSPFCFFAVFLASGVVLLAVTVAVWQGRTDGNLTAVPVPPAEALQNPATGITQHSSDRHQLLIASGIALGDHGRGFARGRVGWWPGGSWRRCARSRRPPGRSPPPTCTSVCDLAGPDDELKELADTFDELLDRLERSFAFERQFVANASHELRTPLAGMRTSLDVAMAKPGPVPAHIRTLADRLRRELDHVDRLLESFLTLAQTQQGPLGDESTVSLAELARLAIERRADAISAVGLDVEQQQRSGRRGSPAARRCSPAWSRT